MDRGGPVMLHWTLIALIFLCGLCAGLNVVQLAMTHTVRMVGLLICLAWAIQQGYWWRTGGDSFALFVACDAAIIAWFLVERFIRHRVFDVRERVIAASIPFTTALGAYAWLRGGHTYSSWYINWLLVVGQMMLGLPTPRRQQIGSAVSHGSVKHGGA